MAKTSTKLIRLRHYTRKSSAESILSDGVLAAWDQNKVFVERASRKPLSPRDAESTYLLKRGKGNAYVEFDVQPDEVHEQKNSITGATELYLIGDVDLTGRNPGSIENG